jgi:hypothetical protein
VFLNIFSNFLLSFVKLSTETIYSFFLYSNNILSSLKTEVQEEIDDDASLPKSLIRHSTEYDNENIPEGK